MYYSILITYAERATKGKATTKPVVLLDDENLYYISEKIIKPYLKGLDFIVDGFILNKSKITRLKIVESEKSIKELKKYKQRSLSPNIIYIVSNNDIINNDELVKDITDEIISNMDNQVTIPKADEVIDMQKVFIVHGRNEVVKIDVARFLEQMGISPIILHEQASQGKTIIEKIEEYSNVGYGIVLYTPCDKGGLADCEYSKLKPRARQNVVFEHGYLIGKLGRNRVCALMKDDVESPNDISGILYIKYQNNNDAWKLELAKELKQAGYNIDLNKLC